MAVLLAEPQRRQLEELLASPVRAIATVAGGDINDAYRIGLADGRRLFVKTNRDAPRLMFAREAEGLAYLEAGLTGAGGAALPLRVPKVVAHSESMLVLEYLESAPTTPEIEEALGRGLALLHASRPDRFGLPHDNFIGRLPQQNESMDSWPEFYGKQRLLAQARLPGAERLLGSELLRRLDRLVGRLPELLPSEPPSRLHGDLWGGNWLSTAAGPYLVDPAVYGGHREVDLAMMSLFGGFGPRVLDAYREALPLSSGYSERESLYQLYPLLVHVNLFGAGYVAGVRRILIEHA